MAEIRKISANGLKKLIYEEGVVLHPYRDAKGIWTIGTGFTYYPDSGKKVTQFDKKITAEQNMYYLDKMLTPYEMAVYSSTRDDINQNQFDGQVLLDYNIGTGAYKLSNLVKSVNRYASNEQITSDFCSWRYVKIKGVKVPMLLPRRKREAALYTTPIISVPALSAEQILIEQNKHIQAKLGLFPDGIYGPATKAKVIQFQRAHKLQADGIAGPRTLELLNAA